jgi:hypothetical protein
VTITGEKSILSLHDQENDVGRILFIFRNQNLASDIVSAVCYQSSTYIPIYLNLPYPLYFFLPHLHLILLKSSFKAIEDFYSELCVICASLSLS